MFQFSQCWSYSHYTKKLISQMFLTMQRYPFPSYNFVEGTIVDFIPAQHITTHAIKQWFIAPKLKRKREDTGSEKIWLQKRQNQYFQIQRPPLHSISKYMLSSKLGRKFRCGIELCTSLYRTSSNALMDWFHTWTAYLTKVDSRWAHCSKKTGNPW